MARLSARRLWSPVDSKSSGSPRNKGTWELSNDFKWNRMVAPSIWERTWPGSALGVASVTESAVTCRAWFTGVVGIVPCIEIFAVHRSLPEFWTKWDRVAYYWKKQWWQRWCRCRTRGGSIEPCSGPLHRRPVLLYFTEGQTMSYPVLANSQERRGVPGHCGPALLPDASAAIPPPALDK